MLLADCDERRLLPYIFLQIRQAQELGVGEYTVWRPIGRDILLSIFEMFHWLLGWYTSYCAATVVTGI